MVERNPLYDAFDACVSRLQAGDSIENCLHNYPQYRDTLRPMLLAAESVRHSRPARAEAEQAQQSARPRFEAALHAAPRQQRLPALLRYAMSAAALLAFSGVISLVASQSALPGDALYAVKRAGEQALITLAGGSEPEQINQRRIDEISALLAADRASGELSFEGLVTAQSGDRWVVGALPVMVAPETPGAAGVTVGDRVRIDGFTTLAQELVAAHITLLDRPLAATPSPVPANMPTAMPPTLFAPVASASPSATPPPALPATGTALPLASPSPTPAPAQ